MSLISAGFSIGLASKNGGDVIFLLFADLGGSLI